MKKLDEVVVVSQFCCNGYPVGTQCLIIDAYPSENPKNFLCFATDPAVKTRSGKWHCDKCLRLKDEE